MVDVGSTAGDVLTCDFDSFQVINLTIIDI
jgi:hypothetical protein